MSDFFLADDLSGALDAGAAFHNAGRRVKIALSLNAWSGDKSDDVVGITTETRNAPPGLAADLVTKVLDRGNALGARLLFKKIDSTMRGPVAAELSAVAQAFPNTRILFSPANPLAGRTVKNGILLVDGTPIAHSPFAEDPISPVTKSGVRELLGSAATARVILPDAQSEDDLERAVNRLAEKSDPWLAIGSGALARATALQFCMVRGAPPPPPATNTRPILMISGSAHPVNRTQATRLQRRYKVPLHQIKPNDPTRENATILESLRTSGGAAISIAPGAPDPTTALEAISNTAATLMSEAGVRRVFVTGGETAFALCRILGISTLHFVEEIENGLSLAHGEGHQGPVLMAVKPGGFGNDETWVHAWQRLVKDSPA